MKHPEPTRTLRWYWLAVRLLHRGIEAAHVVGWCAVDGRSRRSLLSAYAALARQSWSPTLADARVRFGSNAVAIRFRERDIYVIGEMLHANPYRVESAVPAHPLIVDAGANIGLSALWFGARYPGARLHCFEPESQCFALLQHNLAQLPGATCERAALGEHTGQIPLHVTENASDHSVFATRVPTRLEVVPCLRLADYLDRHRIERVDVLKLDVEGSEFAVLKGMGDRIDRVGVIIGEIHVHQVDEVAFFGFLRERGFRLVGKRASYHRSLDYEFEVAR